MASTMNSGGSIDLNRNVDSSQSQDSLFDFKQELSNVVTQLCQGMLPYRNQLVIKGTVGVVADSSVRWNFNINSQTKQKQVDSTSFQNSVIERELSSVVTQLCQVMLPHRKQLTINGTIGVVADSSVRWNFNINSHTKQKQGVSPDEQSSGAVSEEFSSSGLDLSNNHEKDLIHQVSSPTCNSLGSNSDERLNEGSSSPESTMDQSIIAVNEVVIKTEPPSESDLDPCNKEDLTLPMSLTEVNGLVPSVVESESCESLPLKVKLPIKKRKAPLERSKVETEQSKNELKLPKPRPYKCDVCNRCFVRPSELKRHAREHTEEPYKCETCGKVFRSRSSIFKHRSVHTGEKPFTCEICGKTSRTRDIFKMHARTHQGEKPYMCKFCGKSFSQSGHMHRHERSHTGERPYQCQVCGRRFFTNQAARTHEKNLHGDKDNVVRAYKCRICGLSFDTESELVSHKLEHMGPKRFKCDQCEKEFHTEYSLKKHFEILHVLAKFVCEVCGKSYASGGGLHNHKRTHFEGQDKRNLKKIQCSYCPKTFPSTSLLQRHQVTHTGERPFPCQLCETKLTCYSNLQRHYEQVHKQKRTSDWVCKICGESFLSQWLMKLHNKTHAAGDALEVAPPIGDSTEEPPSGESENNTEQYSPAHNSANSFL